VVTDYAQSLEARLRNSQAIIRPTTTSPTISPVSVNLPSAFKNISVPGPIPWHYHWSPVNYSPPLVDPEVILLLGPLYQCMIDWLNYANYVRPGHASSTTNHVAVCLAVTGFLFADFQCFVNARNYLETYTLQFRHVLWLLQMYMLRNMLTKVYIIFLLSDVIVTHSIGDVRFVYKWVPLLLNRS